MTAAAAQLPLFPDRRRRRPRLPSSGGGRARIWTHIANGEHRSEATGALLKRMGVRPGVPDLLIAPDGLHCWMEIKRSRGGTLSEAQRQFRDGSRRARRAQRGLLRV